MIDPRIDRYSRSAGTMVSSKKGDWVKWADCKTLLEKCIVLQAELNKERAKVEVMKTLAESWEEAYFLITRALIDQ